MPCNVVVGYQCFKGHCFLLLHFTLKMEMARSSKTLVSCHITKQCHNPDYLVINSLDFPTDLLFFTKGKYCNYIEILMSQWDSFSHVV